MSKSENGFGYTATAKALHWFIVALLIVQFIIAWIMPEIRRNTQPGTLINLHLSFGVLIVVVAIVRLGWRLTHREPVPEDGLPPWQVKSARVMHWLLYLLLFVVPILGWVNALVAWFPGHGVRPVRFAETDRDARARLWLDRRRAWAAGELRDAGAGRPACRRRALPLFHPPRPRAAADVAGRVIRYS